MRISLGLRRVGVLVAASSVIVGLLAVAPATFAAGASVSTTTINLPMLNPKPVGMTTDIAADVAPQAATGTVTFYDVTGGGKVELATAPLGSSLVTTQRATWTVPADYPTGTYVVMAEYNGDSTYATSDSDTFSFTVGPRPTSTTVTVSGPHDGSGLTAQKGDTITIGAQTADAGWYTPNPVAVAGTISLTLDTVTSLGSFSAPSGSVDIATTAWGLGAHTITATYASSNADHSGSTSAGWAISLAANTVDATASVQYSVFYPYHDGYRDTDAIKGVRKETAKVAIRIYNSSARLVRSQPILSGIGGWSFAWNGRTATGTALPAGKYTVKQIVTDSKGMSKTFIAYITISTKRLYTYTVALKKNATTQVTKKAADRTWFGWSFTLPSATVYKKLVFSVYGKSGVPSGTFGPHSYSLCPSTTYWNPGCRAHIASFPFAASWASVTGSTVTDRKGTNVRMYAVGGYQTSVAYARVTVTYAILK